MMSRLVDFRRLIIYGVCVFVAKGSVMLNVTSSTSKCSGYKINISCVVDSQTTAVHIVMPNGNYASSCIAPLNTSKTDCHDIGQYKTVVSKLGTTTTFVLTIPSLIKSIHNGIWRCQHGDENNTAVLSVIPPLSSKGRVPTITTNSLGGVIVTNVNISGHVYCQNSGITTEILYASQGEQYTVLESEETQWLHSDEGHTGCDPGESNQTYTFPVIWTMPSLTGKKVSFKIRFKQYVCGENFTTNSSGTFIFTGPPMDKAVIINHNSSLLLVPEATSVTLQCVVRGGIPLAVIAWNCLGGNVTNTSVDGIARSNITFLTSKIQNGSFCTCVATHPVAALYNASVQILITYAANITGMVISGDNFTVPEHSRPTITCDAEGSPLPLITLRYVKNNTVIAQTTGLRLQFTLPYARCEDTGKYRCEAVNMFIPQPHVMKDVYVLCSPRRIGTEHMKLVYGIGETLNFTAIYIAYPTPFFKWFFQQNNISVSTELSDGMENVHINNVMVFKSDNILHLTQIIRNSLQIKDFGKYTIKAENYINISYDNLTIINDGRPISSRDVNVVCLDQQRAILTWISEFNNGAKQRFYVQYRSGKSVFNTTAIEDPGQWKFITEEITGLRKSSLYIFTVVATNRFGSTYSKNVKCTTHGENQQLHEEGFIGGIYFAGFFSAIAIAIVLLIVYRKRRCITKPKGLESSKTQNDSKYEDLQTRQEPNAYEMPEHTVQYGSAHNSEQSQYEPVQAGTSISAYEEIKNNRGIDTCSRSNDYENSTVTIL